MRIPGRVQCTSSERYAVGGLSDAAFHHPHGSDTVANSTSPYDGKCRANNGSVASARPRQSSQLTLAHLRLSKSAFPSTPAVCAIARSQRCRPPVSRDTERACIVQQRRACEFRRRHPLHSNAIFRGAGQGADTGQKVRILVIGAGSIDTLAAPCLQPPHWPSNALRLRSRRLRWTNAMPMS